MHSAARTDPFEQYRPALTGHCYRMLGSVLDAEDAVQDTMLRAWRSLDRFEDRASLRTWLTRIATNVCLDALAATGRRRVRPIDASDAPTVVGPDFGRDDLMRTARPREHWVEPIPDALALPADAACSPEEQALLRESVQLAFVAALQYLPPRQRAVLLLTQVLNWSAAETAEGLGMSVAAVNSALQRARTTLQARTPAAAPGMLSDEQRELLARYVAAFERYDVDALTALLHEEATLSMPPYALWLRGPDAIARWLRGPGSACAGSRLVPVTACGGTPAFAQYRPGSAGYEAWAVLVLDVRGARVTAMTSYLDVETLFPRFGLPMRLTGDVAAGPDRALAGGRAG
ncbi:MAG: RNA polymerase sigma factor [uncultured Gemmatimonadaceae bacterium]|uniref:RNA polymerase sigma factor n=1 Tax=uncultured Gemmatimonadaceae bacterium TaxID=246130 RepID=A0A6J4LHN7_9BACT|nr:MAG: RNA polymerase sigma factor [uncultured Gemmatimonadaceae bacterium]